MDKNPGFSFLHEGDLEPRLLPWRHQNMYHVVYCLGYNTGAKFQLFALVVSEILPILSFDTNN